MIQVAILGAGGISAAHADAIRKSGMGRVAAVYAPDASGPRLAAAHNATAAASPEEAIAAADAVVIASPPDTHAALLRAARAAGKHILCEKPVVRTEAEAAEIAALFDSYKPVATVGHVLRFTQEYQQLRGIVQGGNIGQIGTIRLVRAAACPPPGDTWRGDFARSGGVVLDLGVHELDFLEWAFGPVSRVFAMKSTPDAKGNLEYALVVARLVSGAIAHIELSWTEPQGTWYYAYEVAASVGLVEFDSRGEPTLVIRRKPEALAPSIQGPLVVNPMDAQMNAFLGAIRDGKPPVVSMAEGVRALRLGLAVLESAGTNAPVAV